MNATQRMIQGCRTLQAVDETEAYITKNYKRVTERGARKIAASLDAKRRELAQKGSR